MKTCAISAVVLAATASWLSGACSADAPTPERPAGASLALGADDGAAPSADSSFYADSDGTDGSARGRRSWSERGLRTDDADKGAPDAKGAQSSAAQSETQATLAEAALAAAETPMIISVRLPEPADGGLDLRGIDSVDERRVAVAAYHKKLAASQDALGDQLGAVGAHEINRNLLSNHVFVEIPAGNVAALASLPGVLGVSRQAEVTPLTIPAGATGYDGQDVRNALHLNYALAHGVTGSSVSIGVIDTAIPPRHWNMQGRYDLWYCPNTGCARASCITNGQPDLMNPNCQPAIAVGNTWAVATLAGFAPPYSTGHGSYCADLAAGSVEGTQDPSLTTTADRVARSGVARGAHVNLYFGPDGTGTLAAALAQAVINHDNVISMSSGVVCTAGTIAIDCPTTADYSGINADLLAANNNLAMTAVATGDSNSAIGYPAVRPEVLAVGFAASDPVLNPNPDVAPHYAGSGVGPLGFTVYGGVVRANATVGLIAPGQVGMMAVVNHNANDPMYPSASWSPDGYLGSGAGFGASYSAPIVAGSTALMVDAYHQHSWYPNGFALTHVSPFCS